jgi:hypothetical protein
LLGIELFPFYFAGLQNVEGERLQPGLIFEREAECLDATEKTALPVADFGQPRRQLVLISARSRIISAYYAENKGSILRILHAQRFPTPSPTSPGVGSV